MSGFAVYGIIKADTLACRFSTLCELIFFELIFWEKQPKEPRKINDLYRGSMTT